MFDHVPRTFATKEDDYPLSGALARNWHNEVAAKAFVRPTFGQRLRGAGSILSGSSFQKSLAPGLNTAAVGGMQLPFANTTSPFTSELPGLTRRAGQAMDYLLWGDPKAFFPPGYPLQAQAPLEASGRKFDYNFYYNVQIQPRAYESITFSMLRDVSRNSWDVLRLVIETAKSQISAQTWDIVPVDDDLTHIPSGTKDRIKEMTKFFRKPDMKRSFSKWMRMLLEDLFVLDAPCLYVDKCVDGTPYAFNPIDGGTISAKLDYWGDTPLAPETAYQQVIKGLPALNYTTDDMVYFPYNQTTDHAYGYSPVEQVLITINIAARRQFYQLEYYKSGANTPFLLTAPPEFTPGQLENLNNWYNCFDDQTEVLTRTGWKRFGDVDVSQDEFATRQMETAEFQWQKAAYYFRDRYCGDMVKFQNKAIDILVTPNHRMIAAQRKANKLSDFQFVTAAEVLATQDQHQGWKAPATSIWKGSEIGPKSFSQYNRKTELTGDQYCAFMGAYLSEGSLDKRGVVISQCRASKGYKLYLDLLAGILGKEPYYFDDKKWIICRTALAQHCKQFGENCYNKRIPQEILDAPERQLKIFWDYFLAGDGDKTNRSRTPLGTRKTGCNPWQETMHTTSKLLADQLQEVAQKIGFSARVVTDIPKITEIWIGPSQKFCTIQTRYIVTLRQTTTNALNGKVIQYDGMVACVSVPNGTLYVRRNGKPAWTANSMFVDNPAQRWRTVILPYGSKPIEHSQTSRIELKDDMDDYLCTIAAYAFSVDKSQLQKMMNRASAQHSGEQSEKEGFGPFSFHMQETVTDLIQDFWGYDDIKFKWGGERLMYTQEKAAAYTSYANLGALTINEIRADLGKNPLPGGDQCIIPAQAQLIEIDETNKLSDQNQQAQEVHDSSQDMADQQLKNAKKPQLPPGGAAGAPGAKPAKPAGNNPASKPKPNGKTAGGKPKVAKGFDVTPGATAGLQPYDLEGEEEKEDPDDPDDVHKANTMAIPRAHLRHQRGLKKKSFRTVTAPYRDPDERHVTKLRSLLSQAFKAKANDVALGLIKALHLKKFSKASSSRFKAAKPGSTLVFVPDYVLTDRLRHHKDTVNPVDGERLARVKEFVRSGTSMDAPEADVLPDGSVVIGDGRHRCQSMLDLGYATIPLSLNQQSLENARATGLTKASGADDPDQKNLIAQLLKQGWIVYPRRIAPILEEAADNAAHQLIASAGLAPLKEMWNHIDQQTTDLALDRAGELVGMRYDKDLDQWIDNPDAKWTITEDVRDEIAHLVSDAEAGDWSNRQLKTAITDADLFSEDRADTIARTELKRIDSMSSHRVAGIAGATTKHWTISADPNVCEDCMANHEQDSIPIDEDFQDGSEFPPAHPVCRCSIGYGWDEED